MATPVDLDRSVVRRLLLWWMASPSSPSVSLSAAVDWEPARTWLASLRPREGVRVGVNHLVTAAVAKALRAFPEANARVVGRRIVAHEHVGVAMPVNLLGHAGQARGELSMALVTRVETRTVRELASVTTRVVQAERTGAVQSPLLRALFVGIQALPRPVLHGALAGFHGALERPVVFDRVFPALPVTTVVTNPGPVLGQLEGAWLRAAAMSVPQRLPTVTTVWGLGPLQQEVVPVHGVPAVRTVLPLVLVFDHRVLDGVRAGRVMRHVLTTLLDPAEAFGVDADGQPATRAA